MIGKTLGHYEVVEKVGAGGMGEVYRARDTRLHRDVAIKVVPPHLLGDQEHRARFEREARLLASLNHPHIAAIHGLEEHQGQHFLVLEFVTGADLSQRLSQGPMPMEEALKVAGQIADGLEFAHRQGVIHRDLKPSNVALTADGAVKVLDFGLAKALDPTLPEGSSTSSQSPTLLGGATAANVILGTAAYMSPEQARGKPADSRADVWAFGCLIFECLTGRRLFEGASISDTLAAVLRDPVDWTQLPAGTPPALRRLLRRCLERDPARRLHSLADARIELEDAAEELRRGPGEAPVAVASPRARHTAWIPWTIVAALAVTLVLQMPGDRPTSIPERVTRFQIPVDSLGTSAVCPPVISPDGAHIAYSASGHLWLRSLDALEPRPVKGTEHARAAFWSPDGSTLGFQARQRLWRVAITGGNPVSICEVPENFSGSGRAAWGEDGRIVFSTGDSGLFEVLATGGIPVSLLEPDPTRDDDFHVPTLLPGGRGVLFVPHPLTGIRGELQLLRGGERWTLWRHPGDVIIDSPTYDDGHILFGQEQPDPGIWALPFSLDDLRVVGDPFLVASGAGIPSVSRDGTLVYSGSLAEDLRLARVDQDGVIEEEYLERSQHFDDPAVSPSGTHFVGCLRQGAENHIVVHDLIRGTRSVAASGPALVNVFWITDSSVGVARSDSTQLIVYDLGTVAPPRGVFRGTSGLSYQRMSTSPAVTNDRRHVVFTLHSVSTRSDVWIAPLDGSGTGRPLLAGPAREEDPQPSPTAALMAYASDESGRMEIYLTRFDAGESTPSRRWQVSSEGGLLPRWSRDGTRIHYESEGRFMEVEVSATGELALGPPRELFSLAPRGLVLQHGYSVDPRDGKFLMVQEGNTTTTRSIVVVQNWLEEFRQR